MLKDRLTADIKTALLSGDKPRAEVLRSLKSAILYEEVAKNLRDTGLNDQQVEAVFAREAKKRAESAELYQKARDAVRTQAELAEKSIIEEYLPKQLTDDEMAAIVNEVQAAMPDAQMGQLIGAVKAKVGSRAEGGRIAAAVKAKLGG